MSVLENQPAADLTPCISKAGKSRKSKGHRVSICPVEKTVFSDGLNSSSDIDVRKKSRTRLSSLGKKNSLGNYTKHTHAMNSELWDCIAQNVMPSGVILFA